MCGIVGIYNYKSDKPVDLDTIKKMLIRIKHRGPDENGIYLENNLSMGNVRLSILDITQGQQPMSDASERFWIVFNGEIFNYIELKKELKNKGYSFNTNCDTEVIVKLFAEYGIDFLSKLNGQFAIAIWDRLKKELFLARDRVGIRPLFYCNINGVFIFGSEIKSIFENKSIERKLSTKSLSQVFTVWTAISPSTVFENVYELPAGHYLIINKNKFSIHQYWQLNFSHINDHLSLYDAQEQFFELLSDSVKIQLRSDVPVAAYLSGGIDSSIITSIVKQIKPSALNTFSIGFTDSEFDETTYQEQVSSYLNTNHQSIKCTNTDIADCFESVIWHTETPLLRTAPAPMYLLSQLVRKNNIKVVLTGEGADEILGGYNIFKENEIRLFWAKDPTSKIRPLLLKKLYPYLPQMKNLNHIALKLFYGYKLNETDNPLYSHMLRWRNTSNIFKYLSNDFMGDIRNYDIFDEIKGLLPKKFHGFNSLNKAIYLESTFFMSEYLLSSQGDRMAMANSVEARHPFLDYRLIEFCARLPSKFKLNGLDEKYLLKKIASTRVPDTIIKRSKQAYRGPIAQSFLSGNTPNSILEMYSEKKIKECGIFNHKTCSGLIHNMKQSPHPTEIENMSLVAIISTHLLYDQFIENKADKLMPNELLNSKIVNCSTL